MSNQQQKKQAGKKLTVTEVWLLDNLKNHIQDGALNITDLENAMIKELGVSKEYAEHASVTIADNLIKLFEKDVKGETK